MGREVFVFSAKTDELGPGNKKLVIIVYQTFPPCMVQNCVVRLGLHSGGWVGPVAEEDLLTELKIDWVKVWLPAGGKHPRTL